jgi:hypothetical protein
VDLDRRSFLAGLAGGTVLGAGLMLVQAMPFPAGPTGSSGEFFADNGANQPVGGVAYGTSALYDAGLTWVAWESWNGTTRIPEVTGYEHATGYWRDLTAVGISPLVDDDHGPPAICLDYEGHLHAFYGSHGTEQRHSSSMEPISDDSSRWQVNPAIAGEYTYPHPVSVGSNIHLLMRKHVSASTKMPLVLRSTTALAAGVATWGSEVTLVDFDTDSRFYMGSVEKVGTDIHIIATRGYWTDTVREHVYYFIYDTVTGAVKNHDASTTVASGSLPVTETQANTSFRIFTHGGGNDDGGAPALCFDTNGDPHVLFKDGTGSSYAVKHIMRSAGVWSSPVTIATVDNRFNCPVLVQLSGARVEAWYPLDPGGSFTRFGNMVRRERSSAGAWGSELTILTAGSDGLGNPMPVLGGQAVARVVFCEALDSPLDAAAGDLRTYLYGTSGLIPYVATPEPSNSGTADGKELREDGDDELREDNSFELRETA